MFEDSFSDSDYEYLIPGGCDPDDESLIVFNVETTVVDLWLAMALLNRLYDPDAVQNVVKAAYSMQRAFYQPNRIKCPECRGWNTRYRPGQQVIVNLPDGDSFLSRTASPAFSTPGGAFVLVEDHKKAVRLDSVFPTSINCPECVQ